VLAATSGVLRTASVVGVVGGGLVGTVLGPRELFVAAGVAGLLVSGWLGWRLRPDAVAQRVQARSCIPTSTVPSSPVTASATSPV
jgi:uncharacterized protein YcfJ